MCTAATPAPECVQAAAAQAAAAFSGKVRSRLRHTARLASMVQTATRDRSNTVSCLMLFPMLLPLPPHYHTSALLPPCFPPCRSYHHCHHAPATATMLLPLPPCSCHCHPAAAALRCSVCCCCAALLSVWGQTGGGDQLETQTIQWDLVENTPPSTSCSTANPSTATSPNNTPRPDASDSTKLEAAEQSLRQLTQVDRVARGGC